MKSYIETLNLIRSNLELIDEAHSRYPELFSGVSSTTLDNPVPQVSWWSWDSSLETRLAAAYAHRDAGWKREKGDTSSQISWVATICGVLFKLENMEPVEKPEKDLGFVTFPEPQPDSDRKAVVDAMNDVPALAGMVKEGGAE